MDNKFTRLTLEQQDRKITWEISYDDVTGTDMIDALKTLMVGMTFAEDTIYASLANYLMEYAPDKYEVTILENGE